jgi:hypothetical protein
MGKKKAGRKRKASSARQNQQVFDKVGKILYQEMSDTAKAHSLEGLFQTTLPAGTEVVCAVSENIRERGDRLEKQVSDFVLLADGREFEIEFQIRDDETMGWRMFGYGYAQAERRKPEIGGKGRKTVFDFPECAVVYLEATKNTPDILEIGIRHKGVVIPAYEARVYKLLERTLAELEADRLHILSPFYVMKHRRELLDGKPDADRLKALAQETAGILDEIACVLDRGVSQGIITGRDMAVLLEKTYLLYRELYGAIAEFKECMMDFEKKFRSKIPAQWEADREAVVRQTEAKILSLFKQGKTVEEVEALLSMPAGSGGSLPAMS